MLIELKYSNLCAHNASAGKWFQEFIIQWVKKHLPFLLIHCSIGELSPKQTCLFEDAVSMLGFNNPSGGRTRDLYSCITTFFP